MSQLQSSLSPMLSFDSKDTEESFRFYHDELLLNQSRVGMVVMALLFITMAVFETVDGRHTGYFFPAAYLTLAVVATVGLLSSFVDAIENFRQFLLIGFAAVLGLGVIALVHGATKPYPTDLALQIIVLFWIWCLSGMRFYIACLVGIAMAAIQAALVWVFGSENSMLMQATYTGIIVTSAVFAAVAAYFSERATRQTYSLFEMARGQQQVTVDGQQTSAKQSKKNDVQEGDWAKTLQELTVELSSIHDKDLMFNKLIAFMDNIIPNDAAAVGLVKEQSIKSIVTSGALMGHQAEGIRNTLWDTQIFKQLGFSQNPVVKPTNTGMVDGMLVRRSKNFAYRLDVPMYSQKKLVGAVTLLRHEQSFNEYETKIAASCIFHAMMALKTARMQQKLSSQSAAQAHATNTGSASVAPGPNTVPLSSAPLSHKLFREKANPLFDKAVEKGKGVSFLVVEIDQLKKVYDEMGEKIARNVYALVSRSLRNAIGLDDLLGYYGKTGFAVMLIDKDILETQAVAKEVESKLKSQRLRTSDGELEVTLSMGISTFTEDAQDFMAILRSADMALFMVRETGGNGIRVNL